MKRRRSKSSDSKGEGGYEAMGHGRRGSPTQIRRSGPRHLLRIFIYGLLFFFLIFLLVIFSSKWRPATHKLNSLDRLSAALGVQERLDAVIIDAGSTGSRVLAFTFYRSLNDNSLKLDDELWHEVKPGLSSYADDPKKGAESLIPLLDLAKARIPETMYSKTPLVLKATAGLRLLPTEKADALLMEVRKVLQASGFYTTEGSVEIMDGKDEGIFSWFTVNYLFDLITGTPENSLVALDLGGGSTQITFISTDEETLTTYPEENFSTINLFNKKLNLYTHSYLGLGLMAGRAAVLKKFTNDGITNCSCINPIIDTHWTYQDNVFHIKGPSVAQHLEVKPKGGRLGEKRPIADYPDCLKKVIEVIKSQVKAPKELANRQVIAFSYFFDKATERGLIDPFKGGEVTVQKLLEEAKETCNIPNVDQPFACLDMTYIGAFLHYGYGIKPSTHIKLYKKIDNHEVSWALGLAFHVLNNGI